MNGKCEEIKDSLPEFIYGETDNAEKAEKIRAHLKGCRECAAKAAELRKIYDTMRGLRVDFSEDIWKMQRESIIRKIRDKKSKNPLKNLADLIKSSIAVKRLGIAFLLLMAIGAGLQYYDSYRQEMIFSREKAITEKLEFYESIEILERLEFYRTISEEEVL